MKASRHGLFAIGLAAVAIGLAQRLAFFTWLGFALVAGGFLLIFLAWQKGRRGAEHTPRVYLLLFLTLALTAALAPFKPGPRDLPLLVIVLCSPLLFLLSVQVPALRRWRLYATAAPLIAAHAFFIKLVPLPEHQDVFTFLNLGVDALVRGQNPYTQVAYRFTYPPGVLALVAPFRLLLGDIRWSYVAAEIVATLLLAHLVARRSRIGVLADWQVALVALPLALPRVSEAFYVYSNHEWLLLALALIGLLLAGEGHWGWAGVVLGIGIASKQYFLAFPVLFLLPPLRWRSLALALAIAILTVLPFLVWDPHALLGSLQGQLTAPPAAERLTVWAALAHLGVFSQRLGAGLLGLAGIILAALLLLAGRRRGLGGAFLACGLGLALVSLGAPYAAYNYYAYALTFCIWGLLLEDEAEASTISARDLKAAA